MLTLLLVQGRAQRSIEPDSLLEWIAAQQVQEDAFYHDGLFESQRIYKKDKYKDNTLFYSALIALNLKSLSAKMSPENQLMIERIYSDVQQNAFRYRSRRGRPTYNFWQTHPDIAHPNGPAKYQKDKYKLPDDFDDTSVIALLLNDSNLSGSIRHEMVRYTTERKKKVRTTFKRFKQSEAYGVWYADKWKQEFDICVLSNTLRFVLDSEFELNVFDSASIDFIKQSVAADLPFKHPYVLSPYYNETPVILYHLAKLVSDDKKGLFADMKQLLVDDLYTALEHTEFEMHRVILYSSLFRLGEKPKPQVDLEVLKREQPEFYWFSSNFMVAVGTGVVLRKLLNDRKIVPTFCWRCDPFYWTLYLELLVLSADENNESYTLISPTK